MPELDLDELIAAAREDLKSRSKHSFKKSEKAKVAQRVLEGGEVHERLKEVFKRQPGGADAAGGGVSQPVGGDGWEGTTHVVGTSGVDCRVLVGRAARDFWVLPLTIVFGV